MLRLADGWGRSRPLAPASQALSRCASLPAALHIPRFGVFIGLSDAREGRPNPTSAADMEKLHRVQYMVPLLLWIVHLPTLGVPCRGQDWSHRSDPIPWLIVSLTGSILISLRTLSPGRDIHQQSAGENRESTELAAPASPPLASLEASSADLFFV